MYTLSIQEPRGCWLSLKCNHPETTGPTDLSGEFYCKKDQKFQYMLDGEVTHWVENFLYKYEDLSQDHQNPLKAKHSNTCLHSQYWASRHILRPYWAAIVVEMVISRPIKRPYLKNKVQSNRGKYLILTSRLQICMHGGLICVHMCTQIYTPHTCPQLTNKITKY